MNRILTNMKEFYDKAIERPKVGLSDHSSVEIQPKLREKPSQSKETIISRDLRPSKRHAIQIYLEIVDIPRLLDTVETCAVERGEKAQRHVTCLRNAGQHQQITATPRFLTRCSGKLHQFSVPDPNADF